MRRWVIAIAMLMVGCASNPPAPPPAPIATLSWQPVTTLDDGEPLTDLTGYLVTYSAAGSTPQTALVTQTTTQLTLVSGKTYTFYVQAVSQSAGEGLKSSTITKAY